MLHRDRAQNTANTYTGYGYCYHIRRVRWQMPMVRPTTASLCEVDKMRWQAIQNETLRP